MESIYDSFMDGRRRAAQAVAFAVTLGGFCNQTRIVEVVDGPAAVDASDCLPEQEPVEHVRHQGAKQRERQLARQAKQQAAAWGQGYKPAPPISPEEFNRQYLIQPIVDETLTKRLQ